MTGLNGKRLLILGGTTLLIHVVNTAKKMGVYTIVTDNNPSAPAKKYSDKAYNISTGDIDGLIELAKAEKINGVFTGYEDFNTTVACILCSKLGLPFYATQDQIDITKSKILFKRLCINSGVPVVKEYDESNVKFPCITKPSDSYSGRGILICNDKDSFRKGIEYAKSFSPTSSFLVEKYMDSRNVECINIDYIIRDGNIKLSAVGDKYVNDEQGNNTPLTAGVIYPSNRMLEYIETLNDKVIKMFQSIGLKNGTLFIESFYDEEGFHFYEMGYRVGGGQSSILLNEMIGVDYIKMLINYALTGSMCDQIVWEKVNPFFSQIACCLVLLIKPGVIGRIEGIDEVTNMSDVVKYTQFYNIGDEMPEKLKGTLGQTFAKIHIVSKDLKALSISISKIKSSIKVYDENNSLMLLSSVCRKMDNYLTSII
ncbi:MAG: hypothetical protein IKJ81_08205 [Bacteroidales bacterium]|nr:hypothetical protein [Bacteroidales bacterium]